MRKSLITSALLLLPALALAAPPSDPVGFWLVDDEAFAIEVHPCGDGLCGRIAWARPDGDTGEMPLDVNNRDHNARARGLLGLDVVADLLADDQGEWRDGTFYDPRDGKTYHRATVRLTEDGSIVLTGFADLQRRGRTVRSRFSHTVRFSPTTQEALAAR